MMEEMDSCSKLQEATLNSQQQMKDVQTPEASSHSVSGASIPTSSHLGKSRPHSRSNGKSSASSQAPLQSDHAQHSALVPSFQPYNPQPKDLMFYGQGLNFASAIDHQFGSQFLGFNGFPPSTINDVRRSNPRVTVKITHPETKEELKLDEIAKGRQSRGGSITRTHLNVQLQSRPFSCDHYNSVNYFPYMQPDHISLQDPHSVAFSRMELFPSATLLSHNYLDMHGGIVGSNSIHVSSAPIPFKTEFGRAGKKVSSPVSVNSVGNDNYRPIRSRRPSRVGSNRGKSTIQPEIDDKPPQKAVTKPAVSVVSTLRANPSEDGGKTRELGHEDFSKKELMNQGIQDNVEVLQQQQIKTSSSSDEELKLVCSEDSEESPKEISTPPLNHDLKQSDYVSESTSGSTIGSVDTPHMLENTSYLMDISRKNLKNAGIYNVGIPEKKRYSRDFLLTFSHQFVELPADFELENDKMKGLIPGCEAPGDHGHKIQDGNKWKKTHASASTRGGTCGGNLQEKLCFYGGDGSFGSLQQPNNPAHRGRRSKYPDSDRGLVSLPRSSLQVMHKADKKYEVRRKVIDDEEAKQRQLKAILNKLTPQNFDRLFHQVKEVSIGNTLALSGLISQIFDKALMEPTFCEMYANFCWHLARVLPNFVEDHQKITFKRLLLDKCQEEFVRSEREEAEATRREEINGETEVSMEKREEERIRARRRMLGNVRLIGELYKKRMLTERVLRDCINKLLGDDHNPDEEDIEALCQLMSTVGEIIDHPKAKDQMDSYFETMKSLARNDQLPSRIRFMLKDVIDLRNNRWKHRRKVEGPKKLEELHSDAAQERRAVVMNHSTTFISNFASSYVRKSPANFDPNSSAFQPPQTSPKTQGFASPDENSVDKHENQETASVPIPQRSSSDERRATNTKIQHGVSKKMSARGQAMSGNSYNSCSVSKQKPQNIKWQACKVNQSSS